MDWNAALQTESQWTLRTVDLSAFAGKTVSDYQVVTDRTSPAGTYDIYYSDIAIVSSDGTVTPIYVRQQGATFTNVDNEGQTNLSAVEEASNYSGDSVQGLTTTTYYHGDQIGSARMLTAAGGWPVSSDTFYPFGQEQTATSDPNHYKFTGLERDEQNGEVGLDHAMFRQYSSTQGRWMSPDPYNGSMNLSNPQSLNRYSYVGNNPLGFTDPSGLFMLPPPPIDPISIALDTLIAAVDIGEIVSGFFAHPEFQGSTTPRPNVRQCIANCGKPAPASDSVTDGPGFVYGDPTPCLMDNIAAVNAVSKPSLNVGLGNVLGTPRLINGGLNVNFGVPGGNPSALAPGRYGTTLINSFFGLGASLHVPPFSNLPGADPSIYGNSDGVFTFTTHIDSAYSTWHTPLGAVKHALTDVRDHGSHRGPC